MELLIVGEAHQRKRAPLSLACTALLLDSILFFTLLHSLSIGLATSSPWTPRQLTLFFGLWAMTVIGASLWRSPAKWILALERSPKGLLILEKKQSERLTWGFSLLALSVGLWWAYTHPKTDFQVLLPLESRKWIGSLPERLEQEYQLTPFFYLLGAWPKSYLGKPLLYTLPYAKGPPELFVSQIHAHFEQQQAEIIWEGPRTPPHLGSLATLRTCLLTSLPSPSCLATRESTLRRHLSSLDARSLDQFETIEWFRIEQLDLPVDEQTQGIHLRASGKWHREDRYIFFTNMGNHQTIRLLRPKTQEGDHIFESFQTSLASIRVLQGLQEGKSWINTLLSQVSLQKIEKHSLPEVQLLLLSKISVDPNTFDTYYHLSGISLMLMEHFPRLSQQTLNSARRFAEDIDPQRAKSMPRSSALPPKRPKTLDSPS